MTRLASSEIGRFIGPCCVAGVLPLCLVFAADLMFGPWSGTMDNLYYLQAVLGPPLVALLFVPHFGRRAVWVAAGGVVVALLAMLVLLMIFGLLFAAGES